MARTLTTRSRRSAFTLVELIVVMTIIAILVGLLVSAVQRARVRAKEVVARNDIQQLAMAVESFKSRYEVTYLPSRVILLNNLGLYNQAPYNNTNTVVGRIAQDTKAFLLRMWPRLTGTNGFVTWFPGDNTGVYYLEGDQCLVFFLGGLQMNGGCTGFRTNRSNPTDLNSPAEAVLYDFPTARLGLAAPGQGGNSSRPAQVGLSFFDSYSAMPPSRGNDSKCRPYLYFTSQDGNDYCKYGSSDCFGIQQIPQGNEAFPAGNAAPVYAYAESATKFINSNGFQILCAGRNRAFGGGQAGPQIINQSGVGVLWSVTGGYGDYQPGSDDLSNFSPKLLSEPTN